MFVTLPPPPRKWCRLRGNVEKCSRAGQATDDKNGACAFHAGYLRVQTHTVGMHCTAFQLQRGCTNAPQCEVIRSLPILF
jgi:hypothetical protein